MQKEARIASVGLVATVAFALLVGCERRAERPWSGEVPREPTIVEEDRPGQGPEDAGGEPEEIAEPEAPAPAEPESREWQPPRFEEGRQERLRMVSTQIAHRPFSPAVRDARVVEAMRQVPRHLFVPSWQSNRAYDDRPLEIGYGQTISQPYIVAFMTDQLQLRSESRVLEIGTGSGYQAAVLSELTPHVYSIEILEELGLQARERLKTLGYDVVEVKIGDGYYGWDEKGPFDAIIVTCVAGHVPPPLVRQLKDGGRIVIPVQDPYGMQSLKVITKDQAGQVRAEELMPVLFVPMTGRAQQGP